LLFGGCFPISFPLQAQNVFDIGLHLSGARLLHLVSYVPVNIQSKGCDCVPKVSLDRLDTSLERNSYYGGADAVAANRGHYGLKFLVDCVDG